MATVDISTGEVIVLSDQAGMPEMLKINEPGHATCLEDLEQMIVEGDRPVVLIDQKAYRGCDLEALILDLAEFENDRVGGLVLIVTDTYDRRYYKQLIDAGINGFIRTLAPRSEIEQVICEARANRWRRRDQHQSAVTF